MDISLEILIPVVLCIVGICYFWFSSKKDNKVIEDIPNEEEKMTEYAIQLLKNDELESNVLQELLNQGCKQDVAEKILQRAVNVLERKEEKLKLQYLIFGLLFFIGGIVLTIWSYTSVEAHGGSYYIFWGAILVGGYFLYKRFGN